MPFVTVRSDGDESVYITLRPGADDGVEALADALIYNLGGNYDRLVALLLAPVRDSQTTKQGRTAVSKVISMIEGRP